VVALSNFELPPKAVTTLRALVGRLVIQVSSHTELGNEGLFDASVRAGKLLKRHPNCSAETKQKAGLSLAARARCYLWQTGALHFVAFPTRDA
jgi:hypothetical protein